MIRILQGDVLKCLATLPNESVQCVVTSPPYWGLRDYSACSCISHATVPGNNQQQLTNPERRTDHKPPQADPNCPHCHGTGYNEILKTTQIGLEKTPEEYVKKMVEVFREIWRVLRNDGTVWLNLGDSYMAAHGVPPKQTIADSTRGMPDYIAPNRNPQSGLKQKDLVGIPWRVAFALQADGWYLRSDIIWSKPNPMPESVMDRPTKAHEYVFLLAKSQRYFYDADAVREPQKTKPQNRTNNDDQQGIRRWHPKGGEEWNPLGRNRRSVWEIPTQPFPEAHFATFPEALVEPCIKAGCPMDGVVLDPFAGSGTVAKVARDLGRDSIMIEISPAYVEIMKRRLRYYEQLIKEISIEVV